MMADQTVQNYITLGPGETKVMRFDQAVESQRARKDPVTQITSDVRTIVFHVTELGGQPISSTFSVLSQQLQQAFQPYIDANTYQKYRFTLTRGSGQWDAPRIAAAIP